MKYKIKNHENYYINESGIIVDINGNLVTHCVDKDGLMYVTLDNQIESVAKLVLETFSKNPNNYTEIHHKDNDIWNNHILNLEWSKEKENIVLENRKHRKYAANKYRYEVYNENDSVICIGRGNVAKLIQYEEISLKNMIGNGRVISFGPYKGYQIRNLGKIEEE